MTPRPYQLVGRDFLANKRHALLADGMRVGKTPQAILAAAAAKRILVVCPAIATEQWRREWRTWADRDAHILDRGTWPRDGIVVSSFNRATALRDVLAGQRWDLVIVDEAHFAKNPDAQRTKAVYGKQGFAHSAERVWALSGTPAPKHAAELWPMLFTFGATKLSYSDFVARYCRTDALGKILGTSEAMIPELKETYAPFTLRRTRKDVAPEMPDIDFQMLSVRPENEADYSVPDGLEGEALLAWLEAHRTEQAETRQEVAMAKATPLYEEVLEAFDGGLLTQTVIFGYHIAPMEHIAAELKKAGLTAALLNGKTSQPERVRIQDEFRAGRIQVVLANIIAAGTAIDLSAARHAYMLEMSWVPGDNAQAVSRLVNLEKEDKVSVDVVSWPGSHDDIVQRVLTRRAYELSLLF